MKNEATLSQVKKVLNLLEGLDAEQANRVLARIGSEAAGVRKEGSVPHYSYAAPAKVEGAWKVVLKTVPHNEIFFTIAHNVYGNHIRHHRCRYQLRCWRGSPLGNVMSCGRWDPGDENPNLLFETLIEEPPHWECNCCWQQTLEKAGVEIANADKPFAAGSHWRRKKVAGEYRAEAFGFDVLEPTATSN
ncbi:hypothetical protein K2Q00_02695 [Patescibacteria group bacterium]|nr:hypothetical protein [Patescibacteria group bacterium]